MLKMENINEQNDNRDKKGLFIKGNTVCTGSGGRPLSFPTPKDFEIACNSYFKWADETPWIKNDVVRGGDLAGTPLKIPTQRPYTLIALCQHIGITKTCFKDYETKTDYSYLATQIRDKIENQQVEGALVGLFNANLTARLQGLADKKQHEGGDVNKPIIISLGLGIKENEITT